mgnify:CR=1 FL=1
MPSPVNPLDPFHGRDQKPSHMPLPLPALLWLLASDLYAVVAVREPEHATRAVVDAIALDTVNGWANMRAVEDPGEFNLDGMCAHITVRLDRLPTLKKILQDPLKAQAAQHLKGRKKMTLTLAPRLLLAMGMEDLQGVAELQGVADLCRDIYRIQLQASDGKIIPDDPTRPTSLTKVPRHMGSDLSVMASVRIGNPKSGTVAKAWLHPGPQSAEALALAKAHICLAAGEEIPPELQALLDSTVAPFALQANSAPQVAADATEIDAAAGERA